MRPGTCTNSPGTEPVGVRAVLLRRRCLRWLRVRRTTRRVTPSWTPWPSTGSSSGLPGVSLAWGAVGAGGDASRRRMRSGWRGRGPSADGRAGPGPLRRRSWQATSRHSCRCDWTCPLMKRAERCRRCCAAWSAPGSRRAVAGAADADSLVRRCGSAEANAVTRCWTLVRGRSRPSWARLRRRDRSGTPVPRPGLRLAHRRRTAQPAERRDRPAAARDAGLRPPDTGRARRPPPR